MFDTISAPGTAESATSVDALEQELLAVEAWIARLTAHQLLVIRRLDTAQVALADGARSMAEWVASRLDTAPARAGDLVRTARRLTDHPHLESELRDGHATFDRVRATALLADTGAPADSVAASRGLDIAGVHRLAARWRRNSAGDEAAAFDGRFLTLQPTLDQSGWTGWFRLPGLDGRILDRALTHRADEFPADDGTAPQRRADALTSIAQDALTGSTGSGDDTITHLTTVFVDAAAVSRAGAEAGGTLAAGPRVGPNTLEELICTGRVEVIATAGGEPLSVGRASRVISPRLRRAILHRDGGCTADGCTSRYRLQPHHKVPWADGGRTDADNLLTLCWFHHHVVVHGRGRRIDPRSLPGRIRFLHQPRRGPPH